MVVANAHRPDPDELLAKIEAAERARQRGKLKIFLGYAAGVGKTYAMLEAAQQRKAEGIDVVVALVETHQRADTEQMLSGLEVIPRKVIEYRGVQLTETDVDTVLARHPKIAVVDELAHTNAPGSLHPKRYLDVEDLLAAGIDVYTTLNIQHIESLTDVVAQITGVTMHETLPDRIIDEASEIELVDLPPEELLQRLQEGKVYVPNQAARAVRMFFRKGNLTALREMSLRRTAERVDDQMQTYMWDKSITGPWAASERLMVCFTPTTFSEHLVRSTRRLAGELNCEWLAVYVETPEDARLPDQERERISHTLQRAEELGARTETLVGMQAYKAVLEYARKHNVTRLIVGKPLRPFWRERLFGSFVDRLIRESGSIDVFVVSGDRASRPDAPGQESSPPFRLGKYLLSVLLVAAVTGLNFAIFRVVSPINLVMVYLLAVVIAALYLGRGPSVLASFLSVLAFDFFFIPPYLTMAVSDSEYLLTFVGLLVVGFVISQLAARVRDQMLATQLRQAETASLYGLSRDLATAEGLESVLQAITSNIVQTFDREVVIYLPGEGSTLKSCVASSDYSPGENEFAVARWAFDHGQPAGRDTDTLPASEARYLPLKTAHTIEGVLAVRPPDPSRHLSSERYRLLDAFASQAALAIERVRLAEQAQQAKILKATGKLQTALLNSVSHNLRTPLVSITGVLTSLDEQADELDPENRRNLVLTAREEAERLNRLVGNLLSMTRLESGSVTLHRQPGDMQDVIGTALEQLGKRIAGNPVIVDIPDDFPLVPMDFTLLVQVLVNILENAVKYSPAGSPIEVHAEHAGDQVRMDVSDRGIGIPPEDLLRVFDKFYRVQRPESVSGTGLGLAICKGIIDLHGGRIEAHPRPGSGTVISMVLPLSVQEM